MVIPSPKGTMVILMRGSSASDLLRFMVFTLPSLNSSRTDDSGCATDPNQRVLSYQGRLWACAGGATAQGPKYLGAQSCLKNI
ncbi:hypothetical protein HanRHA438_Chr09g0373971 [Helianthus annuus]|nr:hypothetical protein HanRHA438_Chr09g0373971 [Helianthus annuus]